MGSKADRRIKIRRSADGKRTDRVKKAEREHMLRLRSHDKTVEEIALELGRSERTVSKQLQKARTAEEQQLPTQKQKQADPFVEEAQKEHIASIRAIIEEWQRYLFTPLPREVDEKYRHPVSEVEEQRLFKRLREHINNPILWLNHWLWDWYWEYVYQYQCEELRDTIRTEWFAEVGKASSSKRILWAKSNKHLFYKPIFLCVEQWMRKKLKGILLPDEPYSHNYRIEKKQTNKRPARREVLCLYVDDILVGECYDSESAIQAYGHFSDKVIGDCETSGLIFGYLILNDLTQMLHEQLDSILERRSYISNNCHDCPEHTGEDTGFPIRPSWATDSLYDRELKRHFDNLVTVGSVIWSRLEAIVHFKEKYNSYNLQLYGNVADGASWRDPEFTPLIHIHDIMDIETWYRIDTLSAECLMQHFGHRADFNATWTDWRQVNFANIDQETVDKLYSMLARNDIEFCPACPVCHGLKTVFSR